MTDPAGTSYDCPLVLEDNTISTARFDTPTSSRKRQRIIYVDDDSHEEDRTIAAKPSKHPRMAVASAVAASASAVQNQSDDDEEDSDEALANRFQQEEWGKLPPTLSAAADASLAAVLELEEGEDPELTRLCIEADACFAAALYREEQREKEKRKMVEEAAMNKSLDGRAWLFVNQVLDLHKKLCQAADGLSAVSVDDMVFLCKNFLQCATDFQADGLPSHVTLAYHYTRSERMNTIKQDGLMTLADRKATYSSSQGVGVFGDGIYTATNPFAFQGFGGGDTGLLVAVLLGNTQRLAHGANPTANLHGSINTVIGNKSLLHLNGEPSEQTKYTDELVLQKSKQCLPLMQFKTSLVLDEAGKDALWKYHEELQRLLDGFFNKGVRTELKRIRPQTYDPRAGRTLVGAATAAVAAASIPLPSQLLSVSGLNVSVQGNGIPPHLLAPLGGSGLPSTGFAFSTPSLPVPIRRSKARRNLATSDRPVWKPEVVAYTMPPHLMASTPEDAFVKCNQGSKEDCVICMDSLCNSTRVVRLRECGHEYHEKCIKDSLKSFPTCPVCRALISKLQGKGPSGTMSITTSSILCNGYESSGRSLVITYTMPSGTQMSYHDNPGERYQGTTRIAYLPDIEEGRKLLKRLKFAWKRGLTFSIGTSLTTRQPNCITWASIHHKTSPSRGPHGFPDPGFFVNCNGELDSLGVPK